MKYKNQYFQLSQATEFKYKYKTKKEEKKKGKQRVKDSSKRRGNGIPTHKNLVEFMSLLSLDFYQSY